MIENLSVAIVDDERLIRDGLRKVVPWGEYGFAVVADFYSAEQVFDYPSDKTLDLLVVDVCMPVTTGLELIRGIKSLRPETRFVILSGHDSFDYAQEAISLGVLGYLLKPIRVEQMVSVLTRVREAIEEDRRLLDDGAPPTGQIEAIGERLERGDAVDFADPDVRRHFSYATGSLKAALVVEFLPNRESETERVVEIVHRDSVRAIVRRIAETAPEGENPIPLVSRNAIIFLLSSERAIARIVKYVERTISRGSDAPTYRWVAAITAIIDEVIDVKLLDRLDRICETRWWRGSELVYRQSDRNGFPQYVDGSIDRIMISLPDLVQRLSRAIISHDVSHAIDAATQIVAELEQNAVTDLEMVSGILVATYGLLARTLSTQGVDPGKLGLGRLRVTGRDIAGHSFASLRSRVTAIVVDAVHHAHDRSQRPHNRIIHAALDEIDLRYSENIGLVDIADQVGVTPSHLSRLFGNVLGSSFREYLTRVRVDEAKRRLVSSTDKVYEIAAAVGFREQRYFSEVFRKSTGKTPVQYRNEGAK